MTTARINARFAALKAEGRAGFVAYVMAGDPSRDEALEILRGLPAAGADIIELGFPFSDPPEEAGPLSEALDTRQVSLIRLATPTSDDARLKVIARGTSGFVYYVSVAGVTGAKEAVAGDVAPAVERVRAASGLPVAVGFGIRTPERAAEIARVADAVVAGSVLVDEVAAALAANEASAPRALAKVRALSDAVKGARHQKSV